MAKGDICKVEGCTKIINSIGRTICSMHRSRMKKYKSYDIPQIVFPPGIVRECKIHGYLTQEDLIIHTTSKQTFRRCRLCNRARCNKFRKNNPQKYRDNYLRVKDTPHYIKQSKCAGLRKKYGITMEQYEEMYKKQNGLCEICKNPEHALSTYRDKIRSLAVDHCHRSEEKGIMKIRAILCNRCNALLGMAEDSVKLLLKHVDYLLRHK